MKSKLFITLPILLISIGDMAQNKPVEAKKPSIVANLSTAQGRAIQPLKPATDTIYHLAPKDVLIRAVSLQNMAFVIQHPDDVSVNQRKSIIRLADSLSNVDGSWYNVVKPVKKP